MLLGLIKKIIKDFVNLVKLVEKVGYDGVEIMGFEGYLINEFMVNYINKCMDSYGGSFENCMCLVIDIVKVVCVKVSEKFIIVFCLFVMDLILNGLIFEEVK